MSVRKSLVWTYGSQAATFFITFGTSVVMARLLTPREFGVFALASATSAVLGIFLAFGVQSYLLREGELGKPLLRAVFTVNAILNVCLSLALFVTGWVEGHIFGEPDVESVMNLTALTPLIGVFEFIPSTLYMREMRYDLISAVTIIRTLVTAATNLTFAFLGLGATSLATGPVAAGLVGVIIFNLKRPADIILRPSFVGVKPIIVFGLQMMSIGGVAQLAARVGDILLGRILGLVTLGLYSRASNLAGLVYYNVYGLASRVVFVKLSADLREKGTLHETFLRTLQMITAAMWPILLGVAILAGPVIRTLYGPRWVAAAGPLAMLMIAQFVVMAFGMNWELFVLRKETARQTRFEMIRAVVGLGAFTAGATFSMVGAAAGRILEALVGYFLYRPHMDRMAGTVPGELERVYGESLLLTVGAVWPSLLLMLFTRWSADTPLPWIVAAVLVGVATWALLLVRRSHPLLREFLLIVNRKRATAHEREPAL